MAKRTPRKKSGTNGKAAAAPAETVTGLTLRPDAIEEERGDVAGQGWFGDVAQTLCSWAPKPNRVRSRLEPAAGVLTVERWEDGSACLRLQALDGRMSTVELLPCQVDIVRRGLAEERSA